MPDIQPASNTHASAAINPQNAIITIVRELLCEAHINVPDVLTANEVLASQAVFRDNVFYGGEAWQPLVENVLVVEVAKIYVTLVGLVKPGCNKDYISVITLHIGAEVDDQGGKHIVVLYRPRICRAIGPNGGGRTLYSLDGPGDTYYRNVPHGNTFELLPQTQEVVDDLLAHYQAHMTSKKHPGDANDSPFIIEVPDPNGGPDSDPNGDTIFAIFPFQALFGASDAAMAKVTGNIQVKNVASEFVGQRYKHHFVLTVDLVDERQRTITNVDHTSLCPPRRHSVPY